MADSKVICSQCKVEFSSMDKYYAHKCEVTGHKPTEAEHFGEHYKLVQQAALKRGEARVETT